MADNIQVPKTEEAYINDIYNKQKESTLRTLKSAYDSNVSSVNTAQKALETNTYENKREAAGNAAITRQRINETFAANGLNTGAVGQANLALLNQKAANLNNINIAYQQANQEYEAQKAALGKEYQANVASAIQENDAAKAQALYAAWKEQQAQAQALAAAKASSSTGTYRKKASDDDDEIEGDEDEDEDGKNNTTDYKSLLSKAIEESKSPMITSTTTKAKYPAVSTSTQLSSYQQKAMDTIKSAQANGLITKSDAGDLMIQALTPKRY